MSPTTLKTIPFDLAALRAETPGCAIRCHLNNAGAALMPQPVLEAAQKYLTLEAEIGGYEAAEMEAEAIEAVYEELATLVGSKPSNLALVENATAAFAQALSAIPWQAGDVLLTSRNDYVSNQLMFLSLEKRLGVRVVHAPDRPEGGIDPQAAEELLDRHHPRLVAVTWIPTNSGLVQPVDVLGAQCRSRDILYLVDACQAVGQAPIDTEALGCDFLSATGRKYLRAPRGTGFLYVSDRALEAGLEPLFIDLKGAEWTAPKEYRPIPSARRFENWEFPYALVLGLGAAAAYANRLGLETLQREARARSAALREGLAHFPQLRVLDQGTELAAMVTFTTEVIEPKALHQTLLERRINTSLSWRNYATLDFVDKGVDWALRVSPHYYNSPEEITLFLDALTQILPR